MLELILQSTVLYEINHRVDASGSGVFVFKDSGPSISVVIPF